MPQTPDSISVSDFLPRIPAEYVYDERAWDGYAKLPTGDSIVAEYRLSIRANSDSPEVHFHKTIESFKVGRDSSDEPQVVTIEHVPLNGTGFPPSQRWFTSARGFTGRFERGRDSLVPIGGRIVRVCRVWDSLPEEEALVAADLGALLYRYRDPGHWRISTFLETSQVRLLSIDGIALDPLQLDSLLLNLR
jgi:hypothetical protein